MVNSYIASGDVAPLIIFANGPAANAFNAARDALYGWGYTPTFQIDGINQEVGWSQSAVEGYIDSRLGVPCYLSISVSMVGNASGGTATYNITAEEDLGDSNVSLYSAIVESGDIASSGYGYYEGQTMAWEPRAWPVDVSGVTLNFTGPYPQTLVVNETYSLNPSEHTFENLEIVSIVQSTTGNHEVMNAHFMDVPDTATGTFEGPAESVLLSGISIGTNPSTGFFSISTLLPAGVTGTVAIYDASGRIISSFDAAGITPVDIEKTGVYFIQLVTSSGEVLTERCVVIR